MKLAIYFDRKPWSNVTDVFIVGHDERGNSFSVDTLPLVFKARAEGSQIPPTLQFTGQMAKEFFPALVQALSEAGYRYESSDAGELKATKVHLEDMRRLALWEAGK